MHPSIPRLVSVKRLAELYPEQFPQARTRDLIYHSEPRTSARGETIPPNGFASCIVRTGGRVDIDLDAVPLWLELGRVAPLAELAAESNAGRPIGFRSRARQAE